MSGQLRKCAPKDAAPHTPSPWPSPRAASSRYVDPRTFGEIFVVAKDELETKVPEISELGFDPIEDVIRLERLRRDAHGPQGEAQEPAGGPEVHGRAREHLQRRDPVGRWPALRPQLGPLTTQEVRRLYRALVETLHEAIKLRGSTLSDASYVDLYGKPGGFQAEHKVYARDGEACSRCRATIVRHKWSGRSTWLCEACQV